MIVGACGGKLAVITAGDAARLMSIGDSKFDAIRRITGPAGADVIDAVFLIDPQMAWPKEIDRPQRATVVIVGDDPGTPWGQGGAAAWRCTTRLRHWTRAAILHGAAAEPEHYNAVVQAALKRGRATLVETTSDNIQGWAMALRCRQTLLILPRGGLHPVPETEAAQ